VREIDVAMLSSWLDRQKPVLLLDVRTPEAWKEWAIPGSIHVTSEQLKSMTAPPDTPVVTVCYQGNSSRTAAEQLARRGFEVFSLAGGMKAWSLAWNTAEVNLERSKAQVLQIRRTGKGCLSYLLASNSQAIVLDASLPPDVYLSLAKSRGWTIRYTVDTHIHADHLSRSKALAERAAAQFILPVQKRTAFDFTPISDGESIRFGSVELVALATPGHTMESTCFALNGEALFTGDTIFVSGVGRPDLNARNEEAAERARLLYYSLGRLKALSPTMLVFPGHTSEPIAFDGVPVCARLGQISAGLSMWDVPEQDFIESILRCIPPAPPNNCTRITALNEQGILPDGNPTDLEAGANRCAVSEHSAQ